MSKLLNVSRSLICEPWLIRPDVHAVLREILAAHIAGGAAEQQRRELGSALRSNRKERAAHGAINADATNPPYDVVSTPDGNVAVIPLMGVVGHRMGAMEKSSGGMDTLDFVGACNRAASDAGIVASVLLIDSPGGTVAGVTEAAAAVQAMRAAKPVMAYTDSMMASAAYWIGCAADAVYCGPMASVGSVGVYLSLLDQSAAFNASGVRVEMFRSGEYKGMGEPGTALTTEQRAHLQERVDTIGAAFRAHVAKERPGISSAVLDGRDFLGTSAVQNHFADAVTTLEQTISDAASMAKMRK